MSLNVKPKFEDDSWNFYIEGELDISCASILREEIEHKLEEKLVNVKIDMTDLVYIDSTGIGVIVGVMKALRRSGKDIILLNARDNVKKIFKITGLDQILHMEG